MKTIDKIISGMEIRRRLLNLPKAELARLAKKSVPTYNSMIKDPSNTNIGTLNAFGLALNKVEKGSKK